MRSTLKICNHYQHDNVILSLSQSLGIISQFNGNSPEFSSAIGIEMWKKKEGIEIKVRSTIFERSSISDYNEKWNQKSIKRSFENEQVNLR